MSFHKRKNCSFEYKSYYFEANMPICSISMSFQLMRESSLEDQFV